MSLLSAETDSDLLLSQAARALQPFCPGETLLRLTPYGSGHIHGTFLAAMRQQDGAERPLILQRINQNVFKEPEKLTENIVRVTAFLRKKIQEEGGDPAREALCFLTDNSGKPFYKDAAGEYWRCSPYIEGSCHFDVVTDPALFAESGAAFGRFLQQLADYPADSLYESIPGFHDTAARLAAFQKAVTEDPCGRAASVRDEIGFLLSREKLASAYTEDLKKGKIKLRVTHNDTKLNNVLFDSITRRGLCVIDLDTVMPGLIMNDFGDAVRYGCNPAGEAAAPKDVRFDLPLFQAFAEGFLNACGGSLTEEERRLLPAGALVMTYECGLRFLTDYLEGDVYFKIRWPEHNLARARTQIALLKDMERRREEMEAIIRDTQK